MKIIINILLICILPTSVLIGSGKILKGKIGNDEVVLLLNQNGKKLFAQYYRTEYDKGVHLIGEFIDGYFSLKSERYTYSDKVKKEIYEQLLFCEHERGYYSGGWDIEGENQSIWLKEVLSDNSDPYLSLDSFLLENSHKRKLVAQDTFVHLGFEFINFVYNPKNFKGYRHGFESIVFPRSTNHPRKELFNDLMESMQRDYIYDFMLCSSTFNESDFYVNLSHFYVDSFNLSVLVTGEKCCGPRCNYPQSSYNINLITGKEIELPELFSTTRDSISYVLLAKFKTLYPKEYNRNESENCSIKTVNNWKYATWYLQQDGAKVLSNSSYAYRGPCVEYWLFPNEIINRGLIEQNEY